MKIRNLKIKLDYNPITQNGEEGEDPQVQNYPKLHNKILSQAIKKEIQIIWGTVGVWGQDMLPGSEWQWSLDMYLVKRLSVNSSTHKAFSYVCAKSILQQAFHLSLCQGRACSLKLNSLLSKWKLKKKITQRGFMVLGN